jgi:hypothetical protein
MFIIKKKCREYRKKNCACHKFLTYFLCYTKSEHLFCCGILKLCYSSFWVLKFTSTSSTCGRQHISSQYSGGHARSPHSVDQDRSMSCRTECGFAVTPVAQPNTIDRLLGWTSIETIHCNLRRTKRNAFRVLKDSKLHVLIQQMLLMAVFTPCHYTNTI